MVHIVQYFEHQKAPNFELYCCVFEKTKNFYEIIKYGNETSHFINFVLKEN